MIELIPLQRRYCEAVAEIAEKSLPEHWSLEGIVDVLRYDNNIYYVAHDNVEDLIVGFAGIMLIADEAELLNIAVHPGFRDMGIGQRFLEKLFNEAVGRKAARMLLEVRQSNEAAIHLYCKNGFIQLGMRKGYYSNPAEDALIMEKVL